MLGAGDTCLALFRADTEWDGIPPTIGVLHIAFRVDRPNFEGALVHLTDAGVFHRVVEHENCWSIYFVDPDGHQLELTTYEAP